MGFFSSLFGGGGGSSSSTSTTKTEVTVNPVTNIDFNLDELANAIEQGNADAIQVELLKAKLQKEQNDAQLLAQKEQIKAQYQQNETYKKLVDFIPIALIGGGYYLFIYKKGKK